jgi:hypothetical protein
MYVYIDLCTVCMYGMYAFLYVCMHVLMYVCTVCMHACMYVCMYARRCLLKVYVCMYACMHICAQVSLLSEKQPSAGFVQPSHLGDLVVFLSSEAGAEVRGSAWTMDGGWTAQ